MPVYAITTKGEDKPRLVKASSASAAIRHCAQGMFEARTVSGAEDAFEVMAKGVVLETAGQAPAEPEAEAEAESEGEVEELSPPDDDPPEQARKAKAARGE